MRKSKIGERRSWGADYCCTTNDGTIVRCQTLAAYEAAKGGGP